MDEPNYIVVRPAPDLPPGFLPSHLDGMWFDATSLPWQIGPHGTGEAVAVPTGRFEVRDSDGTVAEIYEVRP